MRLLVCLCLALTLTAELCGDEIAAIPRRLPPQGIEIDPADREFLVLETERLNGRIESARRQLSGLPLIDYLPDVEIYTKAAGYALRHGEFFKKGDAQSAREMLVTAAERLDHLLAGRAPWTTQRGLVVRGFRSALDDSVQPYGLVIPDDVDLSQPAPLYVWLHGRGDTSTDLNFIRSRGTSPGNMQPAGAIVLHPFGRYCNGWKSAGEIDVLEAIRATSRNYPVDEQRIVIAGFSMGGAGAWHLGAHYADRWCAVHAGAGFAETARYQNIAPEAYPAWYVQTLWRLYDVPNYVRNLFNLPVVAYSGEEDKQIQAARVMEEAFQAEGRVLNHLIGPGMGHKYHPDQLAEVHRLLADYVTAGNDPYPEQILLQTRTLRYNRHHWIEILALEEHWQDTRVDARRTEDPRGLEISTRNVAALHIGEPFADEPGLAGGMIIDIDGDEVELPPGFVEDRGLILEKSADGWKLVEHFPSDDALRKLPRLQGPIDDAFMAPFLVVLPTGRSVHPDVDRWVRFESQHFLDRWRLLMRGEARVKLDREITATDIRDHHLVLWGDFKSNQLLARMAGGLPINWNEEAVVANSNSHDAATHVPVLIYPNPLYPDRYVVLNSGLTFREAHDGTNSQQNPKLPDWAVIDITEPPSASAPGKVVDAGFFDEFWKWKQ